MTVNYTFKNGVDKVDFDDVFIRRELFTTGGLWGWGYNNSGQLGTDNITSRSSPVQTVTGGSNWKQVSCSPYDTRSQTGVIKTDGTLWMWGYNFFGQLGNNDSGSTASRSSPVQTIAGGNNWKQVSCGTFYTAAIKTDGRLWVWGFNTYGQLGTNNTTIYSSPVQTIAGGTNWKQVSCENFHSSAIKTDGTLWIWGQNIYGQLGTNNTTAHSSPVQTVAAGNNWKQVSCGLYHTAAIKTDGTLWIWGQNIYGQLGTNNTTTYSSPVQTVAAGNNWKQVSCGIYQTVAIKTDGTLWVWGSNTYGQLGTNNTTIYSSPVQTVAAGTNWKHVSSSLYNTSAIKSDGTLWLWGRNNSGQLGTGDVSNRSSPIQTVAAGNNWKQLEQGAEYIFAIREDY
jgi:alpha-tubulin suppressor-like RCC1 family protein